MRIGVLYTTECARNEINKEMKYSLRSCPLCDWVIMAAVHGERNSVVVLYKNKRSNYARDL